MASIKYTILDKETGKFISWFTESTGKVYLVKNPFNSNYFIEKRYAQAWLNESKLNQERYTVIAFEEVVSLNKKPPADCRG